MEAFDRAWSLLKEKRCEADVDPRCTGEADFIVEGDTMEGGGYACSRCIDHYGGDGEVYRLNDDEGFGKSEEKGKFRGYSKNTIEGRAEKQGKARAWNKARKVKRGRTRLRYARNKTRGNVRPKMRRQLGAGGKRQSVSR